MISNDRVLAMLAALDADGRRYALGVLQHEYNRVERERRPTLRSVGGAQGLSGVGVAPTGKVRVLAPDEVALLATCGDMVEDGRDRLVSFARHLQKRFPRQRPVLTLVNLKQRRGV